MTRNEQYDLALEIVKLQDKIKESKKHNKHARLKCNLKKIGALSKIGIAFSAIPLAGTLITCAAGWNPFKLNEEEVPSIITTTIDKEGNETEEKKYAVGSDDIELYYYTAWQKTDSNNYQREIYTYNLIMDIDINSLVKLMNPSQEITQERLEELLKEKIRYHENYYAYKYMKEEYVPTVTDTDLKTGNYIELCIKKRDKTDTKIIKESIGRHISLAVLQLLVEIGLTAIVAKILYDKTYFFENRTKELKAKPYYIDTKELELQLKAKQLLFETIPYQSLPQQQIIEQPEPQKVLKKEPKRMQQQGQ